LQHELRAGDKANSRFDLTPLIFKWIPTAPGVEEVIGTATENASKWVKEHANQNSFPHRF
jgi:hypothetical protein